MIKEKINNSIKFSVDTHYLLQCPVCNNCAKVHIKSESTIKLLKSEYDGNIMLKSMDHTYNFECPRCGTDMNRYRDSIDRLYTILDRIVDDKELFVKTYTPPENRGVRIINDMLIDDYGYPSLALIHSKSDKWAELISLMHHIIINNNLSSIIEMHPNMADMDGALFIKLNESNFNEYFASLHVGMHNFIKLVEKYFFDIIDLISSKLEEIVYNSDDEE
jgi:predicted RNA-binding Zn-ribbon protein involved in translation (DUF1610 family)